MATMWGCGIADKPPCLVLREDGSCAERWPVHPPGPGETGDTEKPLPEPKMSLVNIAHRKATVSRGPGATLGDHVYFAGDDGKHGVELLRTDGERVELVKDIHPGSVDTSIERIVAANGLLYFTILTNGTRELWRSDGTDTGTRFLEDLGAPSPLRPMLLTAGASRVFFASNKTFTPVVMATDGTKVEPFHTLPSDGLHVIQALAAVGDALIVRFDDGVNTHIVRTNGTPTGTITLKKYRPFASSSPSVDVQHIAVANGTVYFIAGALDSGSELWKTDGTIEGTSLVLPNETMKVRPAFETSLVAVEDEVFFFSRAASGEIALLASNGTPEGTKTMASASFVSPIHATKKGVFFTVSEAEGPSLFVTNGATTRRVAPHFMEVIGKHDDKLYFAVVDQQLGVEPWVSDGTSDGTRSLGDLHQGTEGSNPIGLGLSKSGFVFAASDDVGEDQLWTTDGTVAGTKALPRASARSIGSSPTGIGILPSGAAVFFADDHETGTRVWFSDGTEKGTKAISPPRRTEIPPPSGKVALEPNVVIVGSEAWFVAQNEVGIARLFRTDGTTKGTTSFPVSAPPWDARVTAVKNTIYVTDGLERVSFFDGKTLTPLLIRPSLGGVVNDGQRAIASSMGPGVVALDGGKTTEILPDLDNVDITGALALGRKTIFTVSRRDATQFGEIYVTEGDAETTESLIESSGSAAVVGTIDSVRAIVAENGTLWATDGTRANTLPFASGITLHQSRGFTDPRGVAYRGSVFFSATVGKKRGIYKTDGTEEGTRAVALFEGPTTQGPPANLTVFRGRVWFTAYAVDGGRELYSTDGTEAGTRRERDIAEGPRSSNPGALIVAHDVMWFAADDYTNGRELFRMK